MPIAYVGCSGWYYRHWAKTFYPEGLPTTRWFYHYASRFRTVELNAPFYSWPTMATVRGWFPPDRKSRLYLHRQGQRTHHPHQTLCAHLRQLDPRRRNVIEFRHRSWWNEKVYAAFRKSGNIFCSTSGPRLPDELIKTASDVYIRFHGTTRWYLHDYTKEELAKWVTRVIDSGAARVWAYFNNDREGHAIKNARALLRQLKHAGASSASRIVRAK